MSAALEEAERQIIENVRMHGRRIHHRKTVAAVAHEANVDHDTAQRIIAFVRKATIEEIRSRLRYLEEDTDRT